MTLGLFTQECNNVIFCLNISGIACGGKGRQLCQFVTEFGSANIPLLVILPDHLALPLRITNHAESGLVGQMNAKSLHFKDTSISFPSFLGQVPMVGGSQGFFSTPWPSLPTPDLAPGLQSPHLLLTQSPSVCVPPSPKSTCWNPDAQGASVRRWGLLEVIRS